MLRLAREYARGKSCHLRLCFVDMAVSFLRRFSSKFFREHIFELATEMLSDQVANVRLYALQLLPPMKQTVRRKSRLFWLGLCFFIRRLGPGHPYHKYMTLILLSLFLHSRSLLEVLQTRTLYLI